MPQVSPTAEALFIAGSGLSPSHAHTYRFRTRKEQRDFFDNLSQKSGMRYSQMTYQRIHSNVMRVFIPPGELYNCDYMMINPHRHDQVQDDQWWFYAFILAVNYVNEGCTEVVYKIDWVQTYFVDYFVNMNTCFIVRHHSSDDMLFSNDASEGLELGAEYMYNELNWTNINRPFEILPDTDGTFKNWLPIAVFPADKEQAFSYIPTSVTALPNNLEYVIFRNKAYFDRWWEVIEGKRLAEMVDFYMVPEICLNDQAPGVDEIPSVPKGMNETTPIPGYVYNPWDENIIQGAGDGLIPKNNKMYCYPYCFIYVTNSQGNSITLMPQRCHRAHTEVTWGIRGTVSPNPQFTCEPYFYGGTISKGLFKLNLSSNIKVPWVTDAYKVYQSQNASSIEMQNVMNQRNIEWATVAGGIQTGMHTANGIASAVTGAAMPIAGGTKMMQGATQAVDSIINGYDQLWDAYEASYMFAAKQQDTKNLPDIVRNAGGSSIGYSLGQFGFRAYIGRISVQYARRVDRYFTMYGYKAGEYRKPNIFSRPHFNFLKATNVTSNKKVPAQARVEIENVLARGITFWDRNTTIGDYTVDNHPEGWEGITQYVEKETAEKYRTSTSNELDK